MQLNFRKCLYLKVGCVTPPSKGMTLVKRLFSYDTPYGQSNKNFKNIRTLKSIALHLYNLHRRIIKVCYKTTENIYYKKVCSMSMLHPTLLFGKIVKSLITTKRLTRIIFNTNLRRVVHHIICLCRSVLYLKVSYIFYVF